MVLPCLSFDTSRPIPDPACLFPGRPSALWLEIGFGGGEHLAAQAQAHPDIGYIGCEAFLNGVAKALALIEASQLRNVRLYNGDARAVIEALPSEALDGVYLLYPDPWPKRRHHRRRFLSGEMLARLAQVMRPGAKLRVATDIDGNAGWSLARVLRSLDFVWTPAGPRIGKRRGTDGPARDTKRKRFATGENLPISHSVANNARSLKSNRIAFRSVHFARLLSQYSRK